MVSKQRKRLQVSPLRFDTILPPWQEDVAECPHASASQGPRYATTNLPGKIVPLLRASGQNSIRSSACSRKLQLALGLLQSFVR
jgi:hypothetical protein